MNVIRRMENVCADLYKSRFIRGFLHLYAAQEAVCVGMKSQLKPDDVVITAYRCHGWSYVMGSDPHSIIAELMGKVTGVSHGKGGSMHLYAPKFFGGNGIVGAHLPVGTGAGFAFKYKNKPNVSVVLYGDGASNQGQVFESYNLAKLHMLPVDGMDILAVREATRFAVDYCSQGNGPLIMETDTYRYFGHSIADPGVSYRSRDEIKDVRQTRDPINNFKDRMITAQLATNDEIKAIADTAKEEITAATEQAKKDKFPELEELAYDVYSQPLRPTLRGISPWETYKLHLRGNHINH
ncbi:putative pyruvate dehydrogenase E1 component subunit alpha [Blattella germanica]|nr:putative pyruvate dehydrogenase E1 component subunit alpha [Blattella germanica]